MSARVICNAMQEGKEHSLAVHLRDCLLNHPQVFCIYAAHVHARFAEAETGEGGCGCARIVQHVELSDMNIHDSGT